MDFVVVVIICHNLWKGRSKREQNHNLSSPVGSNRHQRTKYTGQKRLNNQPFWSLFGPQTILDTNVDDFIDPEVPLSTKKSFMFFIFFPDF